MAQWVDSISHSPDSRPAHLYITHDPFPIHKQVQSQCLNFQEKQNQQLRLQAMPLEAYTSRTPDKVHSDVLSEARQACHKVLFFFFFFCFLFWGFSFWFVCIYKLTHSLTHSQARDAFYACLDKESNKKPTEIASVGLLYPLECKASRTNFVKHCRPSWVKPKKSYKFVKF